MKSLDRRTICAQAHARLRRAVFFKIVARVAMSARAETSNAYRLCLFTMVYGATVTNQKYTAMYYYLEQKSNEEEGEKERRKSGAKSRARRTKYSINFSSLLFEDQAPSNKLKTAIVLEAVRNFLALMRCSVREPLRFFSWRK